MDQVRIWKNYRARRVGIQIPLHDEKLLTYEEALKLAAAIETDFKDNLKVLDTQKFVDTLKKYAHEIKSLVKQDLLDQLNSGADPESLGLVSVEEDEDEYLETLKNAFEVKKPE